MPCASLSLVMPTLTAISLTYRVGDFLDFAHGRGPYRGAFSDEQAAAAYAARSFGDLAAEVGKAWPLIEAALPRLPRKVTTHGGVSGTQA